MSESKRGCRYIGRFIHHHHGTRTKHRTCWSYLAGFKWKIKLIGRKPWSRASTWNKRFQRIVISNSAAELLSVNQITKGCRAVDDLINTWSLDVTRNCNHTSSRRSLCTNCCVGSNTIAKQPRQICQRLDIVDDRWLTIKPVCGWKERWLEAWHSAISFEAFNQCCFFAHNICTSTPMQNNVHRKLRTQNIFTYITGCIRFVKCRRHALLGQRHFSPYI